MKRSRTYRGFSVGELMVSIGVFSLLSVVLFGTMRFGISSWRAIDSRHEATNALYKAQISLKRDLQAADTDFMDVAQVGGGSGDAIWFLSATDPDADPKVDRKFVFDDAGDPVWQRNIIYYLVRPGSHNDVSNGTTCNTGGNPDGDSTCPHKFLIRKVVNGPDGAEGEILIPASDIGAYLTVPSGYSFSAMTGEANLEDVRLITDDMLWFNVVNFTPGDPLLEIEMAAVRVQEAHKNIAVGQASMLGTRFTQGQTMFLEPRNKGE
jgi:type II secretory pathway pseudopilin PulG